MKGFRLILEEMKARLDKHDGLSFNDRRFIDANYERVMPEPFPKTNCPDKYRDAFIRMYNHIKQFGMKERNYIMFRGHVLHFKGEIYTRNTITDEIAIDYLKLFPDKINTFFEKYPHNWQEIVFAPVAETNKKRKPKNIYLERGRNLSGK